MQKELISEQGFQCFVKEFNQLLNVEKPHWVKEKEIAAAFGDRSENAEYQAAKEMLRNIDKRLRFLKKIIDHSTVVQIHTLNHEKVNFGSEVTLFDVQKEEEKVYIILGTYETNPSLNIISNKSPLGKALLGRTQSDEIELQIHDEIFEYEIIHIQMASL